MSAWRAVLAMLLAVIPLFVIAVDDHFEHRVLFALCGMAMELIALSLAQDDGRVRGRDVKKETL